MTRPSTRARQGAIALLVILLSACATQPASRSVEWPPEQPTDPPIEFEFAHASLDLPRPFTHRRFDDEDGKFTFAVFSDLTGGEREGVFAVAAEQLRLLRPEFVIGVGDLIEGGTEDREVLDREWTDFDLRARRTIGPLFYVGGNHDLINPVQWEVWEARYGPRYYYFVYKDVLFLVLDTEDNPPEMQQEIHDKRRQAIERVNVEGWGIYAETEYANMQQTKTGTISRGQAEYFRQVIADHPGVRWTFLFMHKPAWLKPEERNFLAIEEALADQPYTVFNGHNHDYLYRTRRGRDYIQLGTTGGVQLAENRKAVDHITLVTVSEGGVDIANLEMAGIFDKTGRLPLNGNELCFEAAQCEAQ